jgi:hypothetical protein
MTNPTIVGYTQTFSASAASFFSSPAGGGEEATGWGTPSSLFSALFPTPADSWWGGSSRLGHAGGWRGGSENIDRNRLSIYNTES